MFMYFDGFIKEILVGRTERIHEDSSRGNEEKYVLVFHSLLYIESIEK